MSADLQSSLEKYTEIPRLDLQCPFCKSEAKIPATVGENLTGYMDRKFRITCVSCQRVIEKSSLELGMFAKDYEDHIRGVRVMP